MTEIAPMISLNFLTDHLSVANAARAEENPFGVQDDWVDKDWIAAIAGECGEAINKLKKLFRPIDSNRRDVLMRDYLEELADCVIYLDLLVGYLGMHWADVLSNKDHDDSDYVMYWISHARIHYPSEFSRSMILQRAIRELDDNRIGPEHRHKDIRRVLFCVMALVHFVGLDGKAFERVIASKFNQTSDKVSSKVYIA